MIGNIVAGTFSAGVVPSTTSYESIATVTVGSGGSSYVEFTSIPSTYKHLQIRAISRSDRSQIYDNIKVILNGDTGTNYNYHIMYADGSTVASAGDPNIDFMALGYTAGNSAGSNMFAANVLDLLDYQNTNKYKTIRSLIGTDQNGAGYLFYFSGAWRSTSAVNSIRFIPYSGTAFNQYSQFALYGIKD